MDALIICQMDRPGHAAAKGINVGNRYHKRQDQSCFSVKQELLGKRMNGVCAPCRTNASREMYDMPFALCIRIGNARKVSIGANAVACTHHGYFLALQMRVQKIIGDPLYERMQMEEHPCLSLPTQDQKSIISPSYAVEGAQMTTACGDSLINYLAGTLTNGPSTTYTQSNNQSPGSNGNIQKNPSFNYQFNYPAPYMVRRQKPFIHPVSRGVFVAPRG